MAVNHVILKEFYVQRQVAYFENYLKRFTDMPFLVQISGNRPAKYLRANRLEAYAEVENGDWKLLVWDRTSGKARMPKGTIGFRWAKEDKGKWNLELKDGLTDEQLDPQLSFLEAYDQVLEVEFDDFPAGRSMKRGVPVRYIETSQGRVAVTTVFDLVMAQFSVPRGLAGEYAQDYDQD